MEEAETLIHFVVCECDADPQIAQLDGVAINKAFGAVTPVRASGGKQNFACDLDMRKFAGKLYEGAHHHGTGDAQFVNCPLCKDTEAFQKAFAEHESHTRTDRGRYAGIFARAGGQPAKVVHTGNADKQGAASQGGAEGAVGGSGVPQQPAKAKAPAELPTSVPKG